MLSSLAIPCTASVRMNWRWRQPRRAREHNGQQQAATKITDPIAKITIISTDLPVAGGHTHQVGRPNLVKPTRP